METDPDGALALMQRRVIDLQKLLPSNSFHVIGFADGAGVFYLKTDDGIITVDLKSGRVKMISINNSKVVSYINFYTPDQAGMITRPSTMASSSENVEVAQDEYCDPLLPLSSGQVGEEEEGGRWEEVGNKENEGDDEKGQQVERAVQELFTKGSKAIEDMDFVGAVDCQRRALEIRSGTSSFPPGTCHSYSKA